jgi:hypothetical protein
MCEFFQSSDASYCDGFSSNFSGAARYRDIAAATLASTGRECTSVYLWLTSSNMMILLHEQKKGRITKYDEWSQRERQRLHRHAKLHTRPTTQSLLTRKFHGSAVSNVFLFEGCAVAAHFISNFQGGPCVADAQHFRRCLHVVHCV